jgi:hypothetical protein
MSNSSYRVHCNCGAIELEMHGKPYVYAYCHCQDCRDLLDIPFNSLTAWDSDLVMIEKGEASLVEYQYPGKDMARYNCSHCGELLFNTNKYQWRLVSQTLIRKCNANVLPGELASDKHFYYQERVVDINDQLPKYLQGVDGPLYEEQ